MFACRAHRWSVCLIHPDLDQGAPGERPACGFWPGVALAGCAPPGRLDRRFVRQRARRLHHRRQALRHGVCLRRPSAPARRESGIARLRAGRRLGSRHRFAADRRGAPRGTDDPRWALRCRTRQQSDGRGCGLGRLRRRRLDASCARHPLRRVVPSSTCCPTSNPCSRCSAHPTSPRCAGPGRRHGDRVSGRCRPAAKWRVPRPPPDGRNNSPGPRRNAGPEGIEPARMSPRPPQ